MHLRFSIFSIVVLFCVNWSAVADYKDDIGYTRLLQEQGVNIPDGTGVGVSHVEANSGTPSAYMPDKDDAQFTDKIINNVTNTNSDVSGHATSVGKTFYGSTSSIVPAIDEVDAYQADYWLQPDFLHLFDMQKPEVSSDRVANHSWVGSFGGSVNDANALRRVDWVVETDEFIQCVGLKNTSNLNQSLLSGAYNVIAVGKSDGVNGFGTRQLDSDYVSGRIRPEVVAPKSSSSQATPVVAAAATLLVELGHASPCPSSDPVQNQTTNRAGNTICNAERSEVIKAVLMAGADRVTSNSSSADISDYRAVASQTDNGLDDRFGAGQVNIYNSFHIVIAGEQTSDEDDGSGSGDVGLSGFDYDPFFGGSNAKATYRFSTGADPVVFSATLAWNIEIDGGGNGPNFSGGATRHNLDLTLYDSSGSQVLQASASTIDNTETIWTTLDAETTYLLQVSKQETSNWDFAVAWQSLTDTDGDAVPDSVDGDDDNDGLSDLLEATAGSNPLIADTDGDTLSDGDEVNIHGTNPLLADTDSDGFDDAVEISAGSDPNSNTSIPGSASGDVNDDGVVNVVDVLLATRIVLGELSPTPGQVLRADMVPDGVINAGDLLRIQQQALGL